MKEVDVRGLSCPEPILIVKNTIENLKEKNFKILINEVHTLKNVESFLESMNKDFEVKEVGFEYEIIVK